MFLYPTVETDLHLHYELHGHRVSICTVDLSKDWRDIHRRLIDFVIGLESASSHIAAAVGTPIVSIYSGTTKTSQWRPWGKKVFVVKKDMSCAPCHNFVGCQNMFCLRDIEAYDIIDVIRKKIIPDLSNQRDMM